MSSIFKGRSLNVIEDFSIEERRYFFKKVFQLKKAITENNEAEQDKFRINDPDFGIYSVFLENSTRTRESFKNAAKFHHAKVSELLTGGSSINKGESYADTFNTLSGYKNQIFVVRSTVEGLTRWLSEETKEYTRRNNLPYTPAFINAGDGRHEHPTQELLDEFSFLEDNDMSFDKIHVALVGDLYHGRTVHSKADGLKVFDQVKVDLVAPDELQMPENYVEMMRENGFEVRSFDSIEHYLESGDTSDKWYFTRLQLERIGDQILQKQDVLRRSITCRKDFLDRVKEGTKFYHPLPRHKEHPTIPAWLDDTSFNGWERQSINGYYCRIVLIALIAGVIGEDYVSLAEKVPAERTSVEKEKTDDEDYIQEVRRLGEKKKTEYSEGVYPLQNGLVIDHICKGESPKEICNHMALISSVMDLDDQRGGQWVSRGANGQYKGIIFRPERMELSRKELKRLAAVAPGSTLNIPENFPTAEQVIYGDFKNIEENVQVNPNDYVVVSTHGHVGDIDVLEQVSRAYPVYVGCLGSISKAATARDVLVERGVSRTWVDSVHMPVGEEIFASTPIEIAISIVAEIIRCRAELRPGECVSREQKRMKMNGRSE